MKILESNDSNDQNTEIFRIFMEDTKTKNTAMNRMIDGIPHAIRNSWARMVGNCFTISYRKLICWIHRKTIVEFIVHCALLETSSARSFRAILSLYYYWIFNNLYCFQTRPILRKLRAERTITRTETVLFTCECIWELWNWNVERWTLKNVKQSNDENGCFLPFAIIDFVSDENDNENLPFCFCGKFKGVPFTFIQQFIECSIVSSNFTVNIRCL